MFRKIPIFFFCLTFLAALSLLCLWAEEPCPEQDEEGLLIAIVGDTRPGRNLQIPETFPKIIEILNDIEPDAVFHAGDIIYGKTKNKKRLAEEYKDFLDLKSRLSPPLYIAAGNHDIWDEHSSDLFQKTFGYLYRTILLGNNSFILLNSEIPGQTCRITGDQRAWLESELKRSSERGNRIFVFIHRPMYPVKKHIGSSMDKFPEERDVLHQLFKKFGVYAVISGHEHLYRYMEKEGVHYIISGGGGKKLYGNEEGGGFHHFLLFKIQKEKIHYSVVKVDEERKRIRSFLNNWMK
jgi:3',5'-cyclic AMP phosphodiesterase CpdA